MSSIPSIDMDKEPQGEPEVKKVTRKKKVAPKDSKTNGKTATPDSSIKESVSVAKKKVKPSTESKAELSDDASSLRSRLKPAASRKGSVVDDKSKSKSIAPDGKEEFPTLKKLRPAPSRKASDASRTPKEISIADDVCVDDKPKRVSLASRPGEIDTSGRIDPKELLRGRQVGRKSSAPPLQQQQADSRSFLQQIQLKKVQKVAKQDKDGGLESVKLKPVGNDDDISEASGSEWESRSRRGSALDPFLRRGSERRDSSVSDCVLASAPSTMRAILLHDDILFKSELTSSLCMPYK
ncbi:hypothetical protein ANCCEY_02386 [Ancylostoma ceylanicum]|uniref:Uncharacterized protein n=1 Tax=Ancylostoma ceylanicum TaxID=53326 RepID=A0A0D6M2T6_9BILA|nr:hypothetical protein ANCCEY_02386 [Ancylostoma ceylanicum]